MSTEHRGQDPGRRPPQATPSSCRPTIFDVPANIALMHQVVVAPAGRGPPGHARHEDPRRGPRRRQEAVPPEGHRPRPPGLDPRAAVRRWWHRARPAAARLHAADPEEDEGRRPARCALRPGPRRAVHVVTALVDGDDAVHEGGQGTALLAACDAGRSAPGCSRSSTATTSVSLLSLRNLPNVHLSRRTSSTPTTCWSTTTWCSPRPRSSAFLAGPIAAPTRRRARPSSASRRLRSDPRPARRPARAGDLREELRAARGAPVHLPGAPGREQDRRSRSPSRRSSASR